jgi:hypothetical protein
MEPSPLSNQAGNINPVVCDLVQGRHHGRPTAY